MRDKLWGRIKRNLSIFTIIAINSNLLIIKNINFLKINVSTNLIIVTFVIISKTRDVYYLFNNRVVSLGDTIIDDSVLKYELSIDENNKNNINLFIIISDEKEEEYNKNNNLSRIID